MLLKRWVWQRRPQHHAALLWLACAGVLQFLQPATAETPLIQRTSVYITFEFTDSNGGKRTVAGTGFIVSEAGLVVTAAHLFRPWLGQSEVEKAKNTKTIQGTIGDIPGFGDQKTKTLTIIHLTDPDQEDVAILKLPDPTGDKYPFQNVCENSPARFDDTIRAYGFPLGTTLTPVPGALGERNGPGGRWQASGAFTFGMSGGPVFRIVEGRSEQLIGIVKAGLAETDAVKWITPIEYVRTTWPELCSGKGSEDTAATKTADQFYVYVAYRGNTPNYVLEQYRRSMIAEFFRLSYEFAGVTPVFPQAYDDTSDDDMKSARELFGVIFSSLVNRPDIVANYTAKAVSTLNLSQTNDLYFLLVLLSQDYVAQTESKISATPILLQIHFVNKEPKVTVHRLPLQPAHLDNAHPEKVDATVQSHVVNLLGLLRRLKIEKFSPDAVFTKFSRDAVFIKCIKINAPIGSSIPWTIRGPQEFGDTLAELWDAATEFKALKDKLHAATASSCDHSSNDPGQNDEYMYALARSQIALLIGADEKGYSYSWAMSTPRVASRNSKFFSLMQIPDEGHYGDLLRSWARDITTSTKPADW